MNGIKKRWHFWFCCIDFDLIFYLSIVNLTVLQVRHNGHLYSLNNWSADWSTEQLTDWFIRNIKCESVAADDRKRRSEHINVASSECVCMCVLFVTGGGNRRWHSAMATVSLTSPPHTSIILASWYSPFMRSCERGFCRLRRHPSRSAACSPDWSHEYFCQSGANTDVSSTWTWLLKRNTY